MNVSPVDLVLRVAQATVGASESPPNTNAGPYVERVLARTKTPKGQPWCAAWVADVGSIALGAQWPVPLTASCAQLGDWARDHNVRLVATKTEAQPGDLFLLWFPKLNRFAHVGLVLAANKDGSIQTLEGNTSGAGSREGWLVASRTRTLTSKDRLVRWASLIKDAQ